MITEKVYLQTSLEINSSNSPYIFLLNINFDKTIVRLHFLIISFIHVKFQEVQRSIAMSSINLLILSFCSLKLCIKKKIYGSNNN